MKLFKRSIFLLTTLLALPTLVVACGDDDDDGDEVLVVDPVDAPITASNAEAITDIPIPFDDGGFFAEEFEGVPITLTLNSATTFTASGGGTTLTGTISYGSCTFTPPGAPQGFHDPCSIQITVPPGGGQATGTVTLGNTTSGGYTATTAVQNNNDGTCTVTVGGVTVTSTNCTTTQATGSGGGSSGIVVP